jgi:hypothetical protein
MLPLYVRLGSTALLLAMIDLWGLDIGHLNPRDPVAAMKIWNRNPEKQQPLRDGKRCSALDVQRHLLELTRNQLSAPRGNVPDWSDDVIEAWQRLIDAACDEDNPDRTALDWVLHESLLRLVCTQHGFDWDKLPSIASAYVTLQGMPNGAWPHSNASSMNPRPPEQNQQEEFNAMLHSAAVEEDEFERAIQWLQPMLHLTSTEISEVGGRVWNCLEAELRRHLPQLTDAAIDRASHTPPQDTRAKIRAEFVSQFAGSTGGAGWDTLLKPDGLRIELPDPFESDIEACFAAGGIR